MKIDLSDGVLIEGDEDELRGLAVDIEHAADGEAVEATMLTDDGVETVTIRLMSGETDG